MYCATVYARSGVNQMSILKNKKGRVLNHHFFFKFTASKPMILQHFIRPYLMIN
jgi:hypothetical protein